MYHRIHHMHDTCVLISHICQPCIPNDLLCPPYATWSFFSCLTVISTFGLVVGGGVYDLQFPSVSRIPDVLIMVQILYFPFLPWLCFYVWLLPKFILLADSFLYLMLDFFTYHLWVLKSVKPVFFPVLMSLMTLNLVHNDKFNVVRGELQDHLEACPGTVKILEKSPQPYSQLNSDGEVQFWTTEPNRELLNWTILNQTTLNCGSGLVCGQHPEIYAWTSVDSEVVSTIQH